MIFGISRQRDERPADTGVRHVDGMKANNMR